MILHTFLPSVKENLYERWTQEESLGELEVDVKGVWEREDIKPDKVSVVEIEEMRSNQTKNRVKLEKILSHTAEVLHEATEMWFVCGSCIVSI